MAFARVIGECSLSVALLVVMVRLELIGLAIRLPLPREAKRHPEGSEE